VITAGVALHSLGLTISSEVVRATTFIAGGMSGTGTDWEAASTSAGEAAIGAGAIPAAIDRAGTAAKISRCGAVAVKMAHFVAVVAPCSAVEPQGWTVGLDMADALTMVALLAFGRTGMGALVRFVPGLLAIIAQPFV
jgi:hypothetical protein